VTDHHSPPDCAPLVYNFFMRQTSFEICVQVGALFVRGYLKSFLEKRVGFEIQGMFTALLMMKFDQFALLFICFHLISFDVSDVFDAAEQD
jgi:hypothetical protein